MNSYFFSCLLAVVMLTACNQNQAQSQSSLVVEQKKAVVSHVEIIKLEDLRQLLNSPDDTLRLINFWATWCAPCVKELPYFMEIVQEYPDIELILVSLDFSENIDNKLIPLLNKKNITERVVLLDETNYNTWISLVDESWEGSIPATLLLNNAKGIRKFSAKSFSKKELRQFVMPYLSK